MFNSYFVEGQVDRKSAELILYRYYCSFVLNARWICEKFQVSVQQIYF